MVRWKQMSVTEITSICTATFGIRADTLRFHNPSL